MPSSVYSDSDGDGTKEFTASTIQNTTSDSDGKSTAAGTFTTYFSATITNEITGTTTTTYYSYTSGAIYGGSSTSANNDRAVYVKSGGTFTLLSGTITGFYKTGNNNDNNDDNGSAVYCAGTFNMSGGAVSGNSLKDGYGGAVSINCGTFNMSGGVLSGNNSMQTSYNSEKGGALYVYGTATGAAEVGNGTANITGGYITNNKAGNSGGAIYVDNAKLVIGTESGDNNAVIISDNTGSLNSTTAGGGAIYILGNSSRTGIAQLYIYSGYISNNLSYKAYAGGVAVGEGGKASFTMYGGAITGNIAGDSEKAKKGGGVAVVSGNTMTMSGGYISYNTAYREGGGVVVGDGTSGSTGSFTMSGGYITNNESKTKDTSDNNGGGGIYSNGGSVSITGGTITGNKAGTTGGGISANVNNSNGSLSVTGGVVANNTAATAAADIYAASGTTLTLNTPSSSSSVNEDTVYTGDSYSMKIDNWYKDEADTTSTDDDGNTTTTSNRYNGTSNITTTVSASGSYLSSAVYAVAAHGSPVKLTYDGNAIGTGDCVSSVPDVEYYASGTTATLSTSIGSYTSADGSSVTFLGWTTSKNTKIYTSSEAGSVTTVTTQTMTSDTTVYAAWTYGTNYTLTIKDTVVGHMYYIYQILTGDVGDDLEDGEGTLTNIEAGCSVSSSYTSGSSVLEALTDEDGDYYTGEDLGNAAYKVIDTDSYVAVVVGNGEDITISNLAGGYYIVVDVWSSDNNTSEDGDDSIDGDALSRNVVAVVGDTTVSLKAVTPTITKTITDQDANKAIDDDSTVDTAAIGDTINYKISGTVPDTTGYTVYKYIVYDTLSAGLTLNAKSFKITIGSETLAIKVTDNDSTYTYYTSDGSTYSETQDSSVTYAATVTITSNSDGTTSFVITGLDLTKYEATDPIVITYRARVNSSAVIGTDANTNEAYLEYSNEPNTSSETDDETGKTTNVYTYTYVTELSVIKVDDEGSRLEGATFMLTGDNLTQLIITVNSTYTEVTDGTSTSSDTVYYYKLTDGSYTTTAPSAEEGADNSAYADTTRKYTVTTTANVQTASTETSTDEDGTETSATTISAAVGADGYLTFTGLNAGTYTLSETAPSGYTDMTPLEFTISAAYTYDESSGAYVFSWSTDTESIAYDASSGTFTVTVENLPKAKLTATGGIGTTIFFVVGAALIATACCAFAVRRKRNGAK